MSTTISGVTIGSVLDKRVKLVNSDISRVISVGSTWTRLRIGIRYSMDDLGSVLGGKPRFFVGVHANPDGTNGPTSHTCSNFIGFIQNGVSFTRNAGPPVWYTGFGSGGTSYGTKVGTTYDLTGTGGTQTWATPADPTSRRTVFIVEIEKTGPPWTIRLCGAITVSPEDCVSVDTLKAAMVIEPWASVDNYLQTEIGGTFVGGTATQQGTRTPDEATYGFFNAVAVGWDRTIPAMYISDLMWAKMA